MAAITTPSIDSLLTKLRELYPALIFEPADFFAWQPQNSTVCYDSEQKDGAWQLLHEVGHATLRHNSYQRDIELIGYERDAWKQAHEIASSLGITIPTAHIEVHLDTYRDWLHARSRCVACTQTSIQTGRSEYTCPHCRATWKVNDARTCQLRRYEIKK